jgi:hypothetical protein
VRPQPLRKMSIKELSKLVQLTVLPKKVSFPVFDPLFES